MQRHSAMRTVGESRVATSVRLRHGDGQAPTMAFRAGPQDFFRGISSSTRQVRARPSRSARTDDRRQQAVELGRCGPVITPSIFSVDQFERGSWPVIPTSILWSPAQFLRQLTGAEQARI